MSGKCETTEEDVKELFKNYLSFIKTNELTANSIDLWVKKFEKKVNRIQLIAIIKENELWVRFLKKSLKTCLTEETAEQIGLRVMKLIHNLIEKLSESDASLETTLELIIGHSMFNDIIIDQKFIDSELKEQLVSVLSLIFEKDLKLIPNNQQMVAIVLSAYNSSLSRSDQKLLKLLSTFEKNGLNLYRYQPFMWGIKGAIHYSIKNKEKQTLLKEPKMEQILSLIDQNKMRYTLNHFPIDLSLQPTQVIDISDGHSATDPRFLLPLFYQLLSNQSLVKCHKFVSYGCMSYAISSLSSLCPDMRCLAYCVLSRFHSHLETASFPKDRFLWIALIDCIRAGIPSENSRLTTSITVFLIRIIDVLLHPNDKLYQSVRKFLVNRPTINYKSLPQFYSNLNSSDIETNKRLQRFIISWICDGIRTEEDVKLCLKMNVFSGLMTIFDSNLSDPQNKSLILETLNRTCALPLGAKVLTTEKALFCWLKQIVLSDKDSLFVDQIWRIVRTVWLTFAQNTNSEDIYPSFHYEVIDVLRVIVEQRPECDKNQLLVSNILSQNSIAKQNRSFIDQISNHFFQN